MDLDELSREINELREDKPEVFQEPGARHLRGPRDVFVWVGAHKMSLKGQVIGMNDG